MSQGNHNFYSHLSNCTMEICVAGCPNEIFKQGWEASQKEDDEIMMDSVLFRAEKFPATFMLRIIGHTNALLKMEELAETQEPLWKLYFRFQRYGM